MKIAHVVNPVAVKPRSDLFVAQPLTFKTMLHSKKSLNRQVQVELMTIGYSEDEEIEPRKFIKLPRLERSVLDVKAFNKPRKLPILKDIIDTAIASTDAEFIIYTNSDISLMPYFYESVANYLIEHDALVINRRTINKCEHGNEALPHYFAQVGEKHPGFDCFVFKRSAYEKYLLGNACIGANWIGRVLICNLLAFAENPMILEDSHLTFHLGDDRSWKSLDFIDYDEHNEQCVYDAIQNINEKNLLHKHSLLQRTYEEFFLKMKNPDVTRPTRESKKKADLAHFELFPKEYKPSKKWSDDSANSLNQNPIFVVGHPRSGTTLFQSLLATQVGTPIFPETHFYSIARTFLTCKNDLIQQERLQECFSFLKTKLELSDYFYEYVTEMVERQQLSPKVMFEAIVYDQLCKHLTPEEALNVRWFEKTPDHAEYLQDILRHYPNAKIIDVVRNPEKAILSRRKYFTWNKEEEWPIERHAERWIKTMDSVADIKARFVNAVYTIKFEDMVEDDSNMKAVCDFISVPFNYALLKDFSQYSEQQSLSWENWKGDTKGEVSKEIALKADSCLSVEEKKVLSEKSARYLELFGYEI